MVLDEADQLLAPNFAEDMNHINAHCGKAVERQTVLVSATLSQVRHDSTNSKQKILNTLGSTAVAFKLSFGSSPLVESPVGWRHTDCAGKDGQVVSETAPVHHCRELSSAQGPPVTGREAGGVVVGRS